MATECTIRVVNDFVSNHTNHTNYTHKQKHKRPTYLPLTNTFPEQLARSSAVSRSKDASTANSEVIVPDKAECDLFCPEDSLALEEELRSSDTLSSSWDSTNPFQNNRKYDDTDFEPGGMDRCSTDIKENDLDEKNKKVKRAHDNQSPSEEQKEDTWVNASLESNNPFKHDTDTEEDGEVVEEHIERTHRENTYLSYSANCQDERTCNLHPNKTDKEKRLKDAETDLDITVDMSDIESLDSKNPFKDGADGDEDSKLDDRGVDAITKTQRHHLFCHSCKSSADWLMNYDVVDSRINIKMDVESPDDNVSLDSTNPFKCDAEADVINCNVAESLHETSKRRRLHLFSGPSEYRLSKNPSVSSPKRRRPRLATFDRSWSVYKSTWLTTDTCQAYDDVTATNKGHADETESLGSNNPFKDDIHDNGVYGDKTADVQSTKKEKRSRPHLFTSNDSCVKVSVDQLTCSDSGYGTMKSQENSKKEVDSWETESFDSTNPFKYEDSNSASYSNLIRYGYTGSESRENSWKRRPHLFSDSFYEQDNVLYNSTSKQPLIKRRPHLFVVPKNTYTKIADEYKRSATRKSSKRNRPHLFTVSNQSTDNETSQKAIVARRNNDVISGNNRTGLEHALNNESLDSNNPFKCDCGRSMECNERLRVKVRMRKAEDIMKTMFFRLFSLFLCCVIIDIE